VTVATSDADLKQLRESIRGRIKRFIGADKPGLGGFQRVLRAELVARIIDRLLAEHVDDRDQLDDLINRFDKWVRNPEPTRDHDPR
jgi:transposase